VAIWTLTASDYTHALGRFPLSAHDCALYHRRDRDLCLVPYSCRVRRPYRNTVYDRGLSCPDHGLRTQVDTCHDTDTLVGHSTEDCGCEIAICVGGNANGNAGAMRIATLTSSAENANYDEVNEI
jgi:hypothetical protein